MLQDKEKDILVLTGVVGLIAAILVGIGEFLLHFDPLARFASGGFDFMLAASDERQTAGHFLGVPTTPLYVVGCWHIYLMLRKIPDADSAQCCFRDFLSDVHHAGTRNE